MVKQTAKIKALKEMGSFNSNAGKVKAPLFQHSSFFDPHDLLQVKYEMLRQVLIEHASKVEVTKLFGVSRPTYYEAESAFLQQGLAGLLPQRRGPREAHKLDLKVMAFVEKCIKENQKIRTKELIKLIQNNFNITVHPRSVERAILRKKNYQRTDS